MRFRIFDLLRADMFKLFLAFGAALDPRQKRAHSPGFSPWLVGLSVGASITATGNIRQGFPGAGMETCTYKDHRKRIVFRSKSFPLYRFSGSCV